MTILIVFFTILCAFTSAARELINLDQSTDSKLYNWGTKYKIINAFHIYPGIALTGSAILNVVLWEMFLNVLSIPIYFFVFYQFRNVFMHEILPSKNFIGMNVLQLIGFLVAAFISILYLTV